jgi:NAD-dependent deacetylase
LFKDFKPEYLLSKDCLNHNPKVFYAFYRAKMDCRGYEPNVTHKYLANLEASGKRVSVIPQNIDGLHQKAGSKEVYEIHGTTMKEYCMCCGKEYPFGYIFDSNDAIPRCEKCGQKGFVRPSVTLYGETLPKAFGDAHFCMEEADLCIVAGTSLTVYPASNLVSLTYGKLVIVNRDETEADNVADLVFHENMGEVFGRLTV